MVFDEFIKSYEKKKVVHASILKNKHVVVSVCVVTYNHVNYIKDCLEGILMQKTNFEFEILLGEDDSTDGTRELCLDYAKRFPDKIRLFLHHRENNISIGGQPTGRFNFMYNLFMARGKYIAMCEGDDYWTDPSKLQKQVDFLEKNQDYVVTCHNANVVNEKGELLKEKKIPKLVKDHYYSSLDLQKGAFLLTLSMVFRNQLRQLPTSFTNVLNGDTFLISLLGAYGKGKYIEDIKLGTYRVHSGGIWSKLENLKKLKARRKLNEVLLLHYKNNNQLSSLLYKKQVKLSRVLLRNLKSVNSFYTYLDVNHFYLQHNDILKSKFRLKEFLKLNWFYFFSKNIN